MENERGIKRRMPATSFLRRAAIGFVFAQFLILAASAAGHSSAEVPIDDHLLEENRPVERTLSGGQTHTYKISVQAGEYARVIVDQRGIDVVVRVFAPDGGLVTLIDNPNGSRGAEPVHIVADTSGIYRIEVAVFDKLATGRYEARLAERRPITQVDRDRASARQAFDAAEKLAAEGKPTSYESAIVRYLDARARYASIGEKSEEYTALFGLGMTYEKAGEPQKAMEAFKQALAIARSLGDKYRQARMIEWIAGVQKTIGELENGLQGQIEASRLYRESGDRIAEVQMLDTLGGSYNNLGEHDLARDYFDRALAIYQELGYGDDIAAMHRAIGYSYSLEYQWDKALASYKKGLAAAQTSGSKRQQAINHALIGDEYARAGDRTRALHHVEKALELAKSFSNGILELGVLFNVGSAYYRLGEYDKALAHYDPPLQRYRLIGNKRSEAITLKRIAEALRGKGRFAEARAALERSIELMEFVRDRAGGPDQRAAFVATLYTIYEAYIDILMRLHEAAPAMGHAEAALAFTEKVKMRSLVELLALARVDLRENIDPELLKRERSLNESVTEKLDELAALLRGKFTEAQKSDAERELEGLKGELAQVEAEIRRAAPRYASIIAPQPLSVRDLQQRVLDDESVLLEFKLDDERSYLWAVTRQGVQSYRLPAGPLIEAQARRVHALMTGKGQVRAGPSDAAYWEEADKLSRMILAQVAGVIRGKRLVIVADGALQYLPFAALPSPVEKTKPSGRPLMLDHEIVNLPSASVLDVLRREYGKRQPAPKAAAILADPVYTTDDARVSVKTSGVRGSDGRTGFKRLLFSRSEAETILSVTASQQNLLALDFDPDRRLAMSPELSKYRIIHFSTHGILDSRRPELSGLVLSQVSKTGEPQPGLLRLHEIYNLRLNADLVVLSACQTGLGKDVRGEGLIGLTRGFMYAGAPRVVASLWQVDDAATSALMKEFYRGMLVRNLTPAAALRAAQLEMLKKKAWQSPYYWGAFVLQGEWK